MTSRLPDNTECIARVMTPPFVHDLHSQNLQAGRAFQLDSEAGPSDPQGSYRSYMNTQQMEANIERMPQPLRPVPYFQDRPPMARLPIMTMAYQGLTPRFNPVSVGPTFTQTCPTVSPLHEIPSTSYFVDPHMRQYPRPVPSKPTANHNQLIHIQTHHRCHTNSHLLFIGQYCQMIRLER